MSRTFWRLTVLLAGSDGLFRWVKLDPCVVLIVSRALVNSLVSHGEYCVTCATSIPSSLCRSSDRSSNQGSCFRNQNSSFLSSPFSMFRSILFHALATSFAVAAPSMGRLMTRLDSRTPSFISAGYYPGSDATASSLSSINWEKYTLITWASAYVSSAYRST